MVLRSRCAMDISAYCCFILVVAVEVGSGYYDDRFHDSFKTINTVKDDAKFTAGTTLKTTSNKASTASTVQLATTLTTSTSYSISTTTKNAESQIIEMVDKYSNLFQNSFNTIDQTLDQFKSFEQDITRLAIQCLPYQNVSMAQNSFELHILGSQLVSKYVQSLKTNTSAWMVSSNNASGKQQVLFSVAFFNISIETTNAFFQVSNETNLIHKVDVKNLSPHTSINIYQKHSGHRLSMPVKFAVENKVPTVLKNDVIPALSSNKVLDISVRCVYINITAAKYSSNGCAATVDDNVIVCSCNHTTIFAVLLSVEYMEIPYPVKITSVVIEIFSVICLFFTILLLVKLKRHIRNDRTIVQINLSFSLLFLHMFNLLHDYAKQHTSTCQLVAVLIHFFMLASSMWMMLEGITLVLKTTDQSMQFSSQYQRNINIARLVVGWVVPMLVVAVAVVVGYSYDVYMDKIVQPFGGQTIYRQCWLQSKMLLYSVIIPIGFVLLANTTILIKVAYFVHLKSSQAKRFRPAMKRSQSFVNYEDISATLKAVITLLPVLGLPIIVSFLVGFGENASVVLMYINVLVNGLQGFFLFLLYCINSRVVRRLIVRKTFIGALKRPSNGASSVSGGTAMTSRNGSAVTATSAIG